MYVCVCIYIYIYISWLLKFPTLHCAPKGDPRRGLRPENHLKVTLESLEKGGP